MTLKLDARPKGELVFWVDERLGRNDFPWIFTDEMIDMILEGLEVSQGGTRHGDAL